MKYSDWIKKLNAIPLLDEEQRLSYMEKKSTKSKSLRSIKNKLWFVRQELIARGLKKPPEVK